MGRPEDLFHKAQTEGYGFIQELIRSGQSEELYIDYKQATNGGQGTDLAFSDRKNLAKAVSGFGNSAGGIIIWGVDCRKDPKKGDIPGPECPIENPARFRSWLEGAVSGVTLPIHSGVTHHVIPLPSQPTHGFVVSLIQESSFTPHAAVVKGETSEYYMRAGSNFERVPHTFLAGMFGKRPTPSIQNSFVIYKARTTGQRTDDVRSSIGAGIILHNTGSVIARDLYVNLEFGLGSSEWGLHIASSGLPSGGSHSDNWRLIKPQIGTAGYFVSQDELKLAPAARIDVGDFTISLNYKVEKSWRFSMRYGCDGAPIQSIEKTVSAHDLQQAVTKFMNDVNDASAQELMAFLIY